MVQPILEMQGVSKTFGNVKALQNVSLTLYPGEIHALMGENGAGKSTLMKVLSGAYRPDPGAEIRIAGEPVTIRSPGTARAAGISIIYQELALSPNLTVAQNIFLGREMARGGVLRRHEMEASVTPVLRRLGAGFTAGTKVEDLSVANRQLVEIARALHAESRILIMDEPTTTLSERETEGLFSMMRQLRNDGLAIVYISHRMNEVYELADRVSVLRDGSYAGTLPRAEASADQIVRLMVGRELSTLYTKTTRTSAQDATPVLEVRGLSDGRRFHDCSLSLRAGEVVGIAGLVGSGRTELAQAVFGARLRTAGDMRLLGETYDPKGPQDAIAARIAYLTEDRRGDGLFLDMSCEANINTGVLRSDARGGVLLDRQRARSRADDAIRRLAVRVPDAGYPVGGLSGGNQQKVLLSRWLQILPRVLILDEPTRGVDIGAKSEIYHIIDELARDGVAVLVISSELPEVIGVADRILVMHEGRISGEVGGASGHDPTQENIMALASGLPPTAAPVAGHPI